MSDRIMLRGVRFFGRHGATRRERKIGQWYSLDLDMHLDLSKAAEADDLSQTVDYSEACELALKIGTRNRFRLIETLASRIANALLDAYPQVESVLARVEKAAPSELTSRIQKYGTMKSAAVEIMRHAADADEDA